VMTAANGNVQLFRHVPRDGLPSIRSKIQEKNLDVVSHLEKEYSPGVLKHEVADHDCHSSPSHEDADLQCGKEAPLPDDVEREGMISDDEDVLEFNQQQLHQTIEAPEEEPEFSHAQFHCIIDMAVNEFWARVEHKAQSAGVARRAYDDLAAEMKNAFPCNEDAQETPIFNKAGVEELLVIVREQCMKVWEQCTNLE